MRKYKKKLRQKIDLVSGMQRGQSPLSNFVSYKSCRLEQVLWHEENGGQLIWYLVLQWPFIRLLSNDMPN
jgi:hypothetical protein